VSLRDRRATRGRAARSRCQAEKYRRRLTPAQSVALEKAMALRRVSAARDVPPYLVSPGGHGATRPTCPTPMSLSSPAPLNDTACSLVRLLGRDSEPSLSHRFRSRAPGLRFRAARLRFRKPDILPTLSREHVGPVGSARYAFLCRSKM